MTSGYTVEVEFVYIADHVTQFQPIRLRHFFHSFNYKSAHTDCTYTTYRGQCERRAASAPQSHVFLAPFSLQRLQLVGVGSLAPYRHMLLAPASFRQRVVAVPRLRVVVVDVVEALTPQRHVLLPPPSLVDFRSVEIPRCVGAFAPGGHVVAAPASLLRVESRRRQVSGDFTSKIAVIHFGGAQSLQGASIGIDHRRREHQGGLQRQQHPRYRGRWSRQPAHFPHAPVSTQANNELYWDIPTPDSRNQVDQKYRSRLEVGSLARWPYLTRLLNVLKQNKTSCARGDTICLRPLQVDNIFVFIRQVAPVPAFWLFKTSATSCPLTFWPWKWCPSHVWRGLPLSQF